MPVLCIGNGLVEKCLTWDGVTKGFGNHVFIKHILEDDTVLYSHYCHLDLITCQEGQDINKSDEIGKCGGSGGWPSHLHLELRRPTGKGYDFWPKGMSRDWVAANYLDPYGFIEKHKDEAERKYTEEEMTAMRLERDKNWILYQEQKNTNEGLNTESKARKEKYDNLIRWFTEHLGCAMEEEVVKSEVVKLVGLEDKIVTLEKDKKELEQKDTKLAKDYDNALIDSKALETTLSEEIWRLKKQEYDVFMELPFNLILVKRKE